MKPKKKRASKAVFVGCAITMRNGNYFPTKMYEKFFFKHIFNEDYKKLKITVEVLK